MENLSKYVNASSLAEALHTAIKVRSAEEKLLGGAFLYGDSGYVKTWKDALAYLQTLER